MKIIIAGAGAMGSRFGLMLHQAGNDVIFVDGWPEHIEAIRKNGLVADFNGEVVTAKIPIYPQTEVASIDFTADLVILFTKAMQLAGMLEALEHFLNKNTKVLCLLNGIGHEDI
ncbi:2-dehydropantoate 2-reductase N-terminal domain-containing protein, partial [Enterococcus faecalis]